MKASAISSASPTDPSGGAPSRRSFALTGPSRPLDPRTQAVRSDIADIRLADQVFAPHYAEPVSCVLSGDASLRATRERDAAVVATLRAGDPFELLDVTAGIAWGRAPGPGLVGYLEAAVLGHCLT